MAPIIVIVTLVSWVLPAIVRSECNEAVCAPIVTKCQLLERCSCPVKSNMTCLGECFKCLDYLYLECCHCFGICPTKATDQDDQLVMSSRSHVEDLSEPIPNLFQTLTEEEDDLQRWTTVTIPIQMSFITAGGTSGHQTDFGTGSRVTIKGDGFDEEEDVQSNCTVAYMADCMPVNKCKSGCTSMGASSYRWFHDGCCECIGPGCVNHGVNESKCLNCPIKEDDGTMVEEGQKENTHQSRPDMDFVVGPSSSDKVASVPDEDRMIEDEAINTTY